MQQSKTILRRIALCGTALALGAGLMLSASAQIAPAADAANHATPAARSAIETRQAALKLIGASFKPFGDIVKGAGPYDAAEAQKRLARLAVLSDILSEGFPEASNIGEPDTKSKPDIWTNRADFDKRLKDFQSHIATLTQINATDKAPTDGFKAAVTAVAQDCKGCHETYRVK